MNPIVLVGGGGHAKVLVSILRKINQFDILGYTSLKDNGEILGIPCLGTDERMAQLANGRSSLAAALAVGQVGLGNIRLALWERMRQLSLSFPPIISPIACVNEDVLIGEGVAVMDGAIVSCGARIGRGSIVNTNSTVEHDTVVDDWVHIAPGATVCGGVVIGEFSMVGAGATIIEGRKVGSHCIVGAGSTVVHDLLEPGVYVGCPARRIG